jgi:prepilin-type N-terminal cleavage/methylation domain-containing protein
VPASACRKRADAGFTAIELLLSVAIVATLVGMAIPLATSALEDMRVATAARYLAGRIVAARLDAVQRSTRVALRFEPADGDYTFTAYADGNGNGVRTAEVASGIDPALSARDRLSDRFADVQFGLAAGVPDLDGTSVTVDSDGVRIGTARILTMGPDGTATAGTLYVRGRGRRAQYAVRVLGATARTRTFQYHWGAREWIAR